ASGYVGAIGADVQSVMATFNSINGKKVHGEKDILTGMLRDQLGFEGMVVSDWHGIAQVSGCTTSSCAQAINAGIDMIMAPDSWQTLLTNTVQQVRSGQITEARIDEAVLRILRMKDALGLFDETFDPQRAEATVVGSNEHRALARRAVRESLVVLKNNNQLLPLDPSKHILITGGAANNIAQQSGGWSVTWQGSGISNSDFPGATTLLQGFTQAINAGTGNYSFTVDGSYTTRPDAAIVVFGEQPYAEGAGDLSSLAYNNNDLSLTTLKSLQADGIPTVALFLTGRPRFMNEWINASDAFVVAWLPGTEAAGVADVLLQDRAARTYDSIGRLPFAWPGGAIHPSNAQLPVAATLFERGYGLSLDETTTIPLLTIDPNNNTSGLVPLNEETVPNNPPITTPQDAIWVLRNGAIDARFEGGIKAFDEALGYGECFNDEGAACPSIDWAWVSDTDRGQVLEIFHPSGALFAGLFVDTTTALDVSQFANGVLAFDILHVEGENNISMKLDCFWPCTSGHFNVGAAGDSGWQTVQVSLNTLQGGGLELSSVNTGIVIWATNHNNSRYRVDNVRFMEANQ
ncbi:MAG TPA: glycoside hydrolase family 3 C-terminal domain-containing protein, partial [Pseudomonadales bacterium]|nr:glycoside hydrolase family 3 C-terminal domain-containing protein [Pseudomonadales bacterium]